MAKNQLAVFSVQTIGVDNDIVDIAFQHQICVKHEAVIS